MDLNKQIELLKQSLEKTTKFDDEQEKNDYILDVTSEYKQLLLHNVVSSSDLIVVELSDEEIKIITKKELEQWQKSAIEFDGFEGWIVRGQLVKGL
jgi:polyphosphate kinase